MRACGVFLSLDSTLSKGELLMKLIILVFVLIVAFNLYTRKFRNPYKLIFIFGKKGAGKSTLMVKEMLRHSKRGWTIYTDMEDCIVPGARIIKALDLAKFTPPPRSCLFLEEVGITFDNRNYKSFDAGLRDFYKFMRKYKCKCYMNSQSYDVDKKIRDVVDSMVLQTSIADCIAISRPILKSVTLTEPSAEAESRIAEKLKFAGIWHWKFMWMPRYHKFFDSFAAPKRDPIQFREITRDILEFGNRSQKQLRALERAFNSYEKKYAYATTPIQPPEDEPFIPSGLDYTNPPEDPPNT